MLSSYSRENLFKDLSRLLPQQRMQRPPQSIPSQQYRSINRFLQGTLCCRAVHLRAMRSRLLRGHRHSRSISIGRSWRTLRSSDHTP
jgi:hypothetical protein